MIRFNINGKDIELEDGFDLSFKYDNQLFAFENMQLSRSTSFKIPATPNNNILFNFAKRIEQNGDMMRVPIRASMFYSGGKIDGDIIISDYSDESYNAIFVFGNLLKLKEIKEAGKLKDFLNLTDSVEWSNNTTPLSGGNKPNGFQTNFSIYRYLNKSFVVQQGINFLPTVKFMYLLIKSYLKLGVTISFASQEQIDYLNTVGIKLAGTNNEPSKDINFISLENGSLSSSFLDDMFVTEIGFMNNSDGGFAMEFFRAKNDTIIDLSDVPEYLFILTKDYEFLGNYSFVAYNSLFNNFMTYGMPLSNRSVFIQKGKAFNFFNINNYVFRPILGRWGFGIEYAGRRDYNISGVAGLNGEKLDYGEPYYLQPNLPDVTFIDLLKTATYLTNCSFYWKEETNTIMMFNFDFTNSETIDITGKVISKGKIERKVLEYAQSNLINCESEDYVIPSDKVEKRYYLNNRNVEAEKTLFTFPFSEGNNLKHLPSIFIDDIITERDENNNIISYDIIGKNDTFVQTTTENVSTLQQLQLFSGKDRLQEIIGNGSTMEVRVKMFLFEFLNVRETTVLIIEGKRYVTLSASWSKNVATLTLLLIA